jgi:Mce-associated membrane protein
MAQPTWYDILGVDRAATPQEIKAAWRAATDKFEPGSGSGQFRLFNEAADVLLDPEQRAAYDETLAPEQPPEPPPEPAPQTPAVAPDPTAAPPARASRLFLVVAALTALAVVAALVLGGLVWKKSSDAGIGPVEGLLHGDSRARVDAGDSARSAAERALVAVLSYDYRRMEADRKRALQYLTPKFGKEFTETFDKLLTAAEEGKPGNAVKTKTVVKASVVDTGVMNPNAATTDRVRVLAYVNQAAQKGERSPTIFQNRVAVDMVKRDGSWLVDDLTSY